MYGWVRARVRKNGVGLDPVAKSCTRVGAKAVTLAFRSKEWERGLDSRS